MSHEMREVTKNVIVQSGMRIGDLINKSEGFGEREKVIVRDREIIAQHPDPYDIHASSMFQYPR
jgi:hypothetical protein